MNEKLAKLIQSMDLSEKQKKFIYKSQILVSIILTGMSFIVSPILSVFTAISRVISLAKVPSLKKVQDLLNSTIIDDIFWVGIAILAGCFSPPIIAVVLIVWRVLVLFKNASRRGSNDNQDKEEDN